MVSWRFHPPPGWPVPDDPDWVPDRDWSPDPTWPPAPAGWEFWVRPAPPPPAGAVPVSPGPATPARPATPALAAPPRPGTRRRRTRWGFVALAVVALVPLAIVGTPELADRLISKLPEGARVLFTTDQIPVETMAVGDLDGAPIAVFEDYTTEGLVVLDLATGKQLRTLPGSLASAIAIGEADGAAVALTAAGTTVRVWDLASGQPRHELIGHTERISGVAIGEVAGRPIAATSSDGDRTVRLWDLRTGSQVGPALGPLDDSGPDEALAIVPAAGGPLLVAGRRGGFDVWSLAADLSATRRGSLSCPENSAGLAATPPRAMAAREVGSTMVVISGCLSTVLWDLDTGAHLAVLGPEQQPHAIAVTELDGRPVALVGTYDGPVRTWDLTTARELGQAIDIFARTLAITDIDGTAMVVASDDRRRVLTWPLRANA